MKTLVIQRLYELWDRMTHSGVVPSMSETEKKLEITSNIVFILVIGINISFIPLFIVGIALQDASYWYLVVQLGELVTATIALFIKFRHGRLIGMLLITIITAVYFFLLSVMGGKEGGVHYVFFVYFSAAFFVTREEEWKIRFAVLIIIIPLTIALHIWHKFNDALFPVNRDFVIMSSYLFLAAIMVIISSICYSAWKESYVAEKNIEAEREKSERLLLNILPEEVAAELRDTGKATPVSYESVSVLFTDFVGFTRLAEPMIPEELIAELDACFSRFDEVTGRHSLEKLKTIGDSFMCAGGIPAANHTHAVDCTLAALEILDFMDQMKKKKEDMNTPYWDIRIGIHTGPLVAGVIGEHKFAYDVWGDTVSTARRMESSGAPGRVNISRATYEIVKYFFDCETRGWVTAKNREGIEMFFVKGIKPDYSENGNGRVPNDKFMQLYDRIAKGARIAYRSEIGKQ